MTHLASAPRRLLASLTLLALLAGFAVVATAGAAHAGTDDQATMYDLTNQSRAANGLGPLQWDPLLAGVSQDWAQNLAATGSLGHNPSYVSLINDQVTAQWTRVGENVGYAWALDVVQNAFMNSPGHRANILGDYNRVGIGVAQDGNGTYWVTVNFLKGPDLPGYQPPRTPRYLGWYLRSTPSGGAPQSAFTYGAPGYQTVVGRWSSSTGPDGIGVYVGGMWYLRDSATAGAPTRAIQYGYPGAIPVVGDWNGDGIDTIGVYDGGMWYLRNSNTPGPPDIVIQYGAPGYTPVVGDWNGDGADTIGVFVNGGWYLRNANSAGAPQVAFSYGAAGYVPVVGRWSSSTGPDGIGVFVNGVWYLRGTASPGAPGSAVPYGAAGYQPIVGSWGGTGVDGVGVIVPT